VSAKYRSSVTRFDACTVLFLSFIYPAYDIPHPCISIANFCYFCFRGNINFIVEQKIYICRKSCIIDVDDLVQFYTINNTYQQQKRRYMVV